MALTPVSRVRDQGAVGGRGEKAAGVAFVEARGVRSCPRPLPPLPRDGAGHLARQGPVEGAAFPRGHRCLARQPLTSLGLDAGWKAQWLGVRTVRTSLSP